MLAFDIAAEGLAELGESPVWDAIRECIWWVDVEGCKVLRTDLANRRTRSWAMPERVGFVVLRSTGQPVVGMETGIYAFDPEKGNLQGLLTLDAPGYRFNDATVDQIGRLWVSVMAINSKPDVACIYRVTPKLTLEKVFDGLTTPNGLAVDGNLGRIYFSDSHPVRRKIWAVACELSTGAVGALNAFADLGNIGGRPDGAAIDRSGRYWIAALEMAALFVFSPAGELLDRVDVPFESPTKLAFAGVDGRNLVVTSKAIGTNGGSLAIGSSSDQLVAGEALPHWRAGEI